MQVNLSFDTESEKVDNLKKLVEALEQLIASREGRTYQAGQKQTSTVAAPVEPKPVNSQTAGGCRVIPYEDMSGKMANIFSGGRA
ncbi:hypothetical protein EXS74_01085 [Candidatus Woesearchaeota archaeon]|nr:hypothetical protein [Candidatus Woesearchaeota archaeon]